jgi:predicted transposase YbfD/YdcC
LFSGIEDPRLNRKKRHELMDILVIAVCAIICGAEYWTEVASFGRCKKNWFSAFLSLSNGIPSHDTFARVFAILDSKRLQVAYAQWVQGFMRDVDVTHCYVDGKTVRDSGHMPSGKKTIRVLSAYAHEHGVVLAQAKVENKTNEITAIPEVLRVLQLKGMIVSIDAIGCQKEIDLLPWNESSCIDSMDLFFGGQKWARSAVRPSRLSGSFARSKCWLVSEIRCLWPVAKPGLAKRRITVGGASFDGAAAAAI